jgi:hypothetical protein
MQQLLTQHGYQIPVDGVNGPLTAAAAADFRGSRNPAAFNVGHGLVHGAGPTVVPGVTTGPVQTTQAVPVKPVSVKTKAPAKAPVKPAAKPAATAPAPTTASSDQATATASINAIIAPLIKQITDAETQRASQGQQLISGYTQNAENQLKGIDFQAPYTGAAGSESAVNTALLNELQGQGGAAQNALGATLAQAGTDPTLAAALSARVGADTTGAAGANLAKGDATASQLISQGADAAGYGKKLPGITSLAGAQDVSKLLGQVATDQSTQLSGISSKVPAMVQSELSTLSTARTAAQKNQIASIIAEGYDPTTGQLTPTARAKLAAATGTDPVTGQPTAKTAAAQTSANAAATRAKSSSTAKASASVSKQLGYLADTSGNPILRNGKQVPVSGSGTALSPDAAAKLNATAEKDAENLYWGVTKTSANGTTTVVSHSVQYPEAVKTLAARYPSLGLKGALKLANTLYSTSGKFPDGSPNGRPAKPTKMNPKVTSGGPFGAQAQTPVG